LSELHARDENLKFKAPYYIYKILKIFVAG